MRKKLRMGLMIACVVAMAIMLSGCALASEFDGVWVYSSGGTTETLTLSRTTFSASMSGGAIGSMSAPISAVDESANHFQITLNVSSLSGDYTLFFLGTTFYCTYSISGNQLMLSMSNTGYPATATAGPYIK